MWVAIGQFCAYAIGIVSPMILSRYFNKTDYGTYKQVMYVYNTLTTVFAFGLPKAYSFFIPRVSIGESRDVIRKITLIFLFIGVLFSLSFYFGASFLASILNNPDLETAIKYFAPTPLFLLPVLGLDCILASFKKTHFLAIYTVLTKVFTLLCIVLPVVLFNGTYIHAIIGFDIASLITFILALYLRNIPTRGVSWERSAITVRDILRFSVPLITASIWIMVFQSSSQFFISRYYGTEEFADFSNGFIEFPLIPMVVNSVATVLLPVFSGLFHTETERIKDVWASAVVKSIKVTYPIIVYSILFASLIMTCFYGQQYKSSGIYFLIKNIEGFFAIIPFYPILLAMGKTKQYSNIHLSMAITIIPLEYLVVRLGCAAYMIGIIYVFCSFAKVFLQLLVVHRTTGLAYNNLVPINSIVKIISISALSAISPYLFVYYHTEMNEFILLGITAILFIICYYFLCFVLHVSYKEIISGYLSGTRFEGFIRWIP